MTQQNGKNAAIEQDLSVSIELDMDTWEHLACAAGAISEAEAVFRRLADPARR